MNDFELSLTEACHCLDYEGDAYAYCEDCNGTGEILSKNGRSLLKFLRKYMFTEIGE